ncbi:MAG: desulfoferrodoxin, partial [Agathobacter sp.]|nr:desulfoferrodoxin [Agathobacter sp.]
KHVPIVIVDGDKVTVEVGEVEHPMVEAHYIQWIAIETTRGSQKVKLEYTDKPRAEFKLADGEEFVAAYEYCNLHGLWKK